MYSEPFNVFEFYFYLVEFACIRQLQTRFLQICAPLYVSVTLLEKVRSTDHIGRHTLQVKIIGVKEKVQKQRTISSLYTHCGSKYSI